MSLTFNGLRRGDRLEHPSEACALYRLHSADGSLIYVGISDAPWSRIETHLRKSWGTTVSTVGIEWHPDRPSAVTAERLAIRTEDPSHNALREAVA
jgi:predicted GIY-YIG superfamily endonuclease